MLTRSRVVAFVLKKDGGGVGVFQQWPKSHSWAALGSFLPKGSAPLAGSFEHSPVGQGNGEVWEVSGLIYFMGI